MDAAVPEGTTMNDSSGTHSVLVGYILWLFGFTGSHRFYFGKPIQPTKLFGPSPSSRLALRLMNPRSPSVLLRRRS